MQQAHLDLLRSTEVGTPQIDV
eukprot:COSAG02_NODE_51531_length_313_cov_1.172897_1_plen_21_part_10